MEFDYVIVGAGSAGCVLANRLSADPSISVCLLEAGPPDSSAMIHAPGGLLFVVPPSKFNWSYETTPQAGLNGRRGYQPRGKTLGGSSSINAMVYIRGHSTDYDDWAQLGNHEWTYDQVLPWFKKSENYYGGENDYHGVGGELTVSQLDAHKASYAFIEAAKSCGHHENKDFNGGHQDGVGIYDVTIRKGVRCSTAVAFLHPISNRRANLSVYTNALTQRILTQGKKAIGVQVKLNGSEQVIKARKEVIVAAGAFGSPQLLLLSGIGDPAEMTPHGIQTVHEVPGVGKGLVDHPDYVQTYNSPDTDLNGLSIRGAWNMWRAWGQYKKTNTGRWASNYAEAGGFLKTQEDLSRPDIQLHWLTGQADDHGRKKLWGHGLSCHVCVLRPKSRGSVRLASANPNDAPLIDPGFLNHEDDVNVLLKGFKMVRNIMESGTLSKYRPKELFSSKGMSDERLINLLRQRTDTVYHPVSTCRMGTDEMAVVDQRFKVKGMEGLRVIDASIFPTLMGGNTNAPTIMVAERGAAMILEAHFHAS